MSRSPQVEDGYLKIANTLLDALCRYRISGEQRQVFDTIMRRTYGYNRTWDTISLDKFQVMTGLKKPAICRVIKLLITSRLIIIKEDNLKQTSYRIQKDYSKWLPLTKKITNKKGRPLSIKITEIINKDNPALSKKIIPIIIKDNRTLENPKQAKGLQEPKDNIKDNKEKDNIKDRDLNFVDNFKKPDKKTQDLLNTAGIKQPD